MSKKLQRALAVFYRTDRNYGDFFLSKWDIEDSYIETMDDSFSVGT